MSTSSLMTSTPAPVACAGLVVAEEAEIAEFAASLVRVDYDEEAPVTDVFRQRHQAFAVESPATPAENPFAPPKPRSDVEKAFAEADHVIKETLRVHRGGCHAIETRGIVAQFDPKAGFLTIWASCQGPHRIRRTLLQLMDMPEHRVRVIAPRVGGGFGPKGGFYPENFLVPWLAVRFGTAIKWIWAAGLANTHDVMLDKHPRGVAPFMSDYAAGGYSFKRMLIYERIRIGGRYIEGCSYGADGVKICVVIASFYFKTAIVHFAGSLPLQKVVTVVAFSCKRKQVDRQR